MQKGPGTRLSEIYQVPSLSKNCVIGSYLPAGSEVTLGMDLKMYKKID